MEIDRELLCGVDLGGTKIAIALVDRAGAVVEKTIIRDHRRKPEDAIIGDIATAIRDVCDTAGVPVNELSGVGVGTSGHVDTARGVVISNSNLPGFKEYPLRQKLQDRIGVPVRLDNDANAQAYAEFSFGAGKGYTNMTFVTASTGVGAGIVIDSRIYRGVTGTAGEFGHTIVNPAATLQCGCGNYGCLMAYTSGLNLPQTVRQKLSQPGTPAARDLSHLPDEELNGEFIKKGYEENDPLCVEILHEYADYMAIGLYNLFQILNPALLVLGGGLTAWGEPYIARIRNRFYGLARNMMYTRLPIEFSEIGHDAAVIGAASLLLEPDSP